MRRLKIAAALALAVTTHLAVHAGMLLTSPGYRVASFRDYFPFDQLSYLAIAIDVSQGGSGNSEPFTETGSIHYPRLYYVVLGLLSRLLHVSPLALWTVGGLAAQALLVVALGLTCVRLSGRPWTALLAPLPLAVGTLSTVTDGTWRTKLDSHAVLWGPFGDLFTLNGESVALCLAGTAVCVLLAVQHGDWSRGRVRLAVLGSAAVLGVLASVQTYAFLTGAYLVGYAVALAGLLRAGRRAWWLASAALLLGLLALGPSVAPALGPLAVLGLGLLPAVPGLWLLLREQGALGWGALATAGAFAAPQVLGTLWAVHSGDPFLLYRQSSSKDLGVPVGQGLVAAVPVALVLAYVLCVGLRAHRTAWTSASGGVLLAWALLAGNDRWGANQEPYRLWIDGCVLAAVAALPLAVWVAAETWQTGPVRRLALVAVLVPAVVSLADVRDFRGYVRDVGFTVYASPQLSALRTAMTGRAGGPVLPDPCTEPRTVKVVAGGPVAYYNLGLAWPEHEPAYRDLLAARAAGTLDVAAAREAGVTQVLTDSACRRDWATASAASLRLVREAAYVDGRGRPQRMALWDLVGT